MVAPRDGLLILLTLFLVLSTNDQASLVESCYRILGWAYQALGRSSYLRETFG